MNVDGAAIMSVYRKAMATLGMAIALLLLAAGAGANVSVSLAPEGSGSEVMGSGDGRIHIIPALSAPSVKNGEALTIQAVVRSERPVVRVEARIERLADPAAGPVAVVELLPAPANLGGVNAGGTMGLWQTEWTAAGLEEATYAVTITARNASGHTVSDRSLRFTDPIAGHDQVGSTEYPGGGMRWIDSVDLGGGCDRLSTAVIDVSAGFIYFGTFGTFSTPACVVKVALGNGSNPPHVVGELILESGEEGLRSSVIDPVAGYAWFGTDTTPGRVIKVALGEGDAPPARVGALTLEEGENSLRAAVIDAAAGYAYFGTYTGPGRVVKVTLGEGDAPPARVGALTLATGDNQLSCAVIDPVAEYAWFGTRTFPGRIIKVALGEGDDPPTQVGSLTLEGGYFGSTMTAAIDPASGYAYFAGSDMLFKVALGTGNELPSQVGSVARGSYSDDRSAIIDPVSGDLFLAAKYSPPVMAPGYDWIERFSLTDDDPTFVARVTLRSSLGSGCCGSAVIDPDAGYVYIGWDLGHVDRVGFSLKGSINATRLTMPEAGRVNNVHFYSHAAEGNVRLAMYDDGAEHALLWQSGVISNTAAESWLSASIAAGTPAVLDLPPGNYWLAWQVDTPIPVASWTEGQEGDGLYVPWNWGSFPSALSEAIQAAPTFTKDLWSAYLAYETDALRALSVVVSGLGAGSVTSDPTGIDCGMSCSAGFPHGTTVTLTAAPQPGSVFAGWSGGGCSGTGECVVVMDEPRTVVAVFDLDPATMPPLAIIPSAARLEGVGGAFFSSRVELFTPGGTPLPVAVTYTPRADIGGEVMHTVVIVPPGVQLEVDDSLHAWFGIGDGQAAAGTLSFAVPAGREGDLLVQSVVSARNSDGSEYGQFFPAVPVAGAVQQGQQAFLATTVDAVRNRINLGLVGVEDGTELIVAPVDPIGTPLAEARTFTLDAGVSRQLNDLNRGAQGFDLGDRSDYLVQVDVESGAALAFVSVLDGTTQVPGTSDPTTILPVVHGSAKQTLVGIGPVMGIDEFTGSAGITNLSNLAAVIGAELYLRDDGQPRVAATATVELGPGETRGYVDIVGDLFGLDGVGSVVLTSENGAEFFVTGREYAIFRDEAGQVTGTAGQLVPGLSDEAMLQAGLTYHLLGLRQRQVGEALERTNLLFFNPGEEERQVVVRMFDGATGVFEGQRTEVIGAGEMRQFNRVVSRLNSGQDGEPKRIELVADGPIFASASRVNKDGDPVTILPLAGGLLESR